METERSLNEQARFLQEFQNDLLSREISLFYEQQVWHSQASFELRTRFHNLCDNHRFFTRFPQRLLVPPMPAKRKGKFKKAKIAKLLSKEGCINISLPKGLSSIPEAYPPRLWVLTPLTRTLNSPQTSNTRSACRRIRKRVRLRPQSSINIKSSKASFLFSIHIFNLLFGLP